MRKRILSRTGVIAGVTVGVLLIGTVASALVTGQSGRDTVRQYFKHQTTATLHSSPTFANVGSAVQILTISNPRVINARFSAETACTGVSGYCSVRIVVVDAATGARTELDPAAAYDFAIDTAGSTDNWEGHAIERTSGILPAGTYRVRVQAAVVSGAANLRLDDWTLAVEVIRP